MQEPAPFYEKLSRSLISIVLIFFILYWAKQIMVPLAFASLFALLLIKPCNLFERIGTGRGIAALIVTLVFIVAGFFVIYFISLQVIQFRNDLPKLVQLFLTGFHELETRLTRNFNISIASIDELIRNASKKTFSDYSYIIGPTVGTISGTLVSMILVPIFTFLLLYYRSLVMVFFISIFPEKYTGRVKEVAGKVQYVTKAYIIGLLIEMAIVATFNCLGFFILGVKYALLLGIIAALLNVIPYLGIFSACIISLLITSATNTPAVVAGVAIILLAVHLLDSNIILPKVVGSKVKINVLATILSVLTGSILWGIPGMFLSIPIIAILKIVFENVESLKPWSLLIGDDQKPSLPNRQLSFKKWFREKKKSG